MSQQNESSGRPATEEPWPLHLASFPKLPDAAREARADVVRRVFGYLFTAEEINLAMSRDKYEAVTRWLGALFDEGYAAAASSERERLKGLLGKMNKWLSDDDTDYIAETTEWRDELADVLAEGEKS